MTNWITEADKTKLVWNYNIANTAGNCRYLVTITKASAKKLFNREHVSDVDLVLFAWRPGGGKWLTCWGNIIAPEGQEVDVLAWNEMPLSPAKDIMKLMERLAGDIDHAVGQMTEISKSKDSLEWIKTSSQRMIDHVDLLLKQHGWSEES